VLCHQRNKESLPVRADEAFRGVVGLGRLLRAGASFFWCHHESVRMGFYHAIGAVARENLAGLGVFLRVVRFPAPIANRGPAYCSGLKGG
jgi:hypothetical protein